MANIRKCRRIIKKALIIFLLLVAATAITFATPLFNIKNIEITGNKITKVEELILASGLQKGKNIFMFSKTLTKNRMKKLVYVSDVKIKRSLPGCVKIEIIESEICAYIENGGKLAAIDENKRVLEIFPLNTKRSKPLLNGVKIKKAVVGKTVDIENQDIYKIAELCMDKLKEGGIYDITDEIAVDKKLNITVTTKAGLKAKLGSTDEIDYKFNYLKTILKKIGAGSGGFLDITNTDKVPYRKSEN